MLMRLWAGIQRGELDVRARVSLCVCVRGGKNVSITSTSALNLSVSPLPSPGQRVPSGRETPRGEANSDPENNHPSQAPHRDPAVQEPGRRQPCPRCPQPRPSKGPDPREGGEESHSHQEEVDESKMSPERYSHTGTHTGHVESRWSYCIELESREKDDV